MSEQRRRIIPAIVPKQDPSKSQHVVIMENTDQLLQDLVSIISVDIVQMKNQVNRGQALRLEQSRVLHGHAKVLLDINRDTREAERADDLSKLSTEELIEALQASAAKKQLTDGKK